MKVVEPNRVSSLIHRSQLHGFPAQWILHFGEVNLSKSPLSSDYLYGDELLLGLRILEGFITARSGSAMFH